MIKHFADIHIFFLSREECTFLTKPAVIFPIFQSATYEYESTNEGVDYHSIRYARLNNTPTHNVLHAKLALLEGGGEALATGSGMAAITTVLFATLKAGDHMLLQDGGVYGGTHTFVAHDLPKYGISFDLFDGTNSSSWAAKLKPNTRVIYSEAATNPLGIVADHRALVEFAKKHKLVSIIDSTLLSPVFFKYVGEEGWRKKKKTLILKQASHYWIRCCCAQCDQVPQWTFGYYCWCGTLKRNSIITDLLFSHTRLLDET